MESAAIVDPKFEVLAVLGEGAFGKVLKSKDQISGRTVAVKLIRKDRTQLESFLLELHVSRLVSRHENMIYTYPTHVYDVDHFVLVQELAPCGTLHSLIEPQFGIPEEMVKRCAGQLASALHYMHTNRLIHGDLKPDNVLLMDKDWRLSNIIPYTCPELCCLQENEYLYLTPSVDVWAFGVLLYVALTGSFPWEKAVELDHGFQVFADWQNGGDYSAPPNGWETFTAEAKGMFCSLLSLEPTTRPGFKPIPDFLHCPWKMDVLIDRMVLEGEAFLVTTEEGVDQIIILPGDELVLLENGDVEIDDMVVESEIMYVVYDSSTPTEEPQSDIALAI
uniref:Protein kinase domain-containing protein n=1 Tax=Leptobrachium leishanense TaxID=445787 RepID=A0A8C5MRK6_9ANUR